MELRYWVANGSHMSVIRQDGDGLVIEVLEHSRCGRTAELRLTEAAGMYDVCQDDQDYVHLVYLNRHQQLVHARIHPDQEEPRTSKLPGEYAGLAGLKLACCANRLHLLLQYASHVEHAALTGIHWHEPAVMAEADRVIAMQWLTSERSLSACGLLMRRGRFLLCRWNYDSSSGTWSAAGEGMNLPPTDAGVPSRLARLPASAVPAPERPRCLLVRLLAGQLAFAIYESEMDGCWQAIAEEAIAIPAAPASVISCGADYERLRFSWAAEDMICRIDYDLATSTWGPLSSSASAHPVLWCSVTGTSSGGPEPQWIADGPSIREAIRLSGMELDAYRADRDFRSSIHFAKQALASVERLSGRITPLEEERKELEQCQQMVQSRIADLERRLSILEEELRIRRSIRQANRLRHNNRRISAEGQHGQRGKAPVEASFRSTLYAAHSRPPFQTPHRRTAASEPSLQPAAGKPPSN
ncbi:transcriptional regulator [Paenibacillus thiaminolyticus]|uniref:Transcriptional regulator n=1 Tax=Paenibacillus thiaminolyticus TaxID=49283 RepID=A0A3A3H2L6_PANTH|nr:transcriptional regulator [Paenibacillus thiaminolyticus]RJG23281.1 transcriptional regulator [Paenibacillus thiaminolyticus]